MHTKCSKARKTCVRIYYVNVGVINQRGGVVCLAKLLFWIMKSLSCAPFYSNMNIHRWLRESSASKQVILTLRTTDITIELAWHEAQHVFGGGRRAWLMTSTVNDVELLRYVRFSQHIINTPFNNAVRPVLFWPIIWPRWPFFSCLSSMVDT